MKVVPFFWQSQDNVESFSAYIPKLVDRKSIRIDRKPNELRNHDRSGLPSRMREWKSIEPTSGVARGVTIALSRSENELINSEVLKEAMREELIRN